MQGEAQLLPRLGLSVPREWWPAAALLKEIEAAGLSWVQVETPPTSVLTSPRECVLHARALAESLRATTLRRALHAPSGLMAGEPAADRALAGAISYAAECGAEFLVYHALALPDGRGAEDRLLAEARSLAALAPTAERLGVTIALENLAPVYPGPETISANPLAVRTLARRIGSPAVGVCLDVGHANVIAGLRRTSLTRMVAPVLDSVVLFHLHDNLGARWRPADRGPGIDPLRLDLHLAPGAGTLAWAEIASSLRDHEAPLIMEVHPPRAAPGQLAEDAYVCLTTIDSSEFAAPRQRSMASSRAL